MTVVSRKMFVRPAIVGAFLAVLTSCVTTPKSDPLPAPPPPDLSILTLMPGMAHELPCKIALPDSYIAVPFGKKPSMENGMLWGQPATLEKIRLATNNGTKNATWTGIDSCIFSVHLSQEIAQISLDTFNAEPHLAEALKAAGLTNIKIEKRHWGLFPVLNYEAQRPDGSTVFSAWIGLDVPHAGWTVQVDFRCPDGAAHPTDGERAVWRNFLELTYQLPQPLFSQAMGFVHVDGKTEVKNEGIEFNVLAETLARGGESAALIDSHTLNTNYEVIHAMYHPDWTGRPGLVMCVRITHRVNANATDVFDQWLFVTLKTVDEFSLIGRRLTTAGTSGQNRINFYLRDRDEH